MVARKPDPEEGVDTEVGATSGRTHAEVLEQTLGPERAHDVLSANGPPPVPSRRSLEKR